MVQFRNNPYWRGVKFTALLGLITVMLGGCFGPSREEVRQQWSQRFQDRIAEQYETEFANARAQYGITRWGEVAAREALGDEAADGIANGDPDLLDNCLVEAVQSLGGVVPVSQARLPGREEFLPHIDMDWLLVGQSHLTLELEMDALGLPYDTRHQTDEFIDREQFYLHAWVVPRRAGEQEGRGYGEICRYVAAGEMMDPEFLSARRSKLRPGRRGTVVAFSTGNSRPSFKAFSSTENSQLCFRSRYNVRVAPDGSNVCEPDRNFSNGQGSFYRLSFEHVVYDGDPFQRIALSYGVADFERVPDHHLVVAFSSCAQLEGERLLEQLSEAVDRTCGVGEEGN